MTADNNILVSTSGDPTAYAEAGIYCSAQADGSLTFKCTTTPTEDVLVSVYIGGSISGENEITVDEEMSDESTNPVQNKVIKKYIDENAGGGGCETQEEKLAQSVGGIYKHELMYVHTIENMSYSIAMTLYIDTPTPISSFAQLNTLLLTLALFKAQNGAPTVHEAFIFGKGVGLVKGYYVFPKHYNDNDDEDGEICFLTGVYEDSIAVTECRLDRWNTSSNLDYYIEDGAATLADTVTAL